MRQLLRWWVLALLVASGCESSPGEPADDDPDLSQVVGEVEAAVWAFHAADTARDAEAVVSLLWPDYAMLADGNRLTYSQVVAGSREFMRSLALFHTEWDDLQVTPLTKDLALASFLFRDSIVTHSGGLIRAEGPTTFLWERREGAWKLRFADADHYPIPR